MKGQKSMKIFSEYKNIEEKARKILFEMVSIDSSNPALGHNCPGEKELGEYVSTFFSDMGFPLREQEVEADRKNILVTLPGCTEVFDKDKSHNKPVLLFEIHLDTVARSSMEEKYQDPLWEGNRLFGRGSCDTKGSLASILLAFQELAQLQPEEIPVLPMLCAAVDEEVGALGVMAFIDSGIKVDGAIVGEPTELVPRIGHKGVVRWKVETLGKACHSSNAKQGVNAIMQMNKVLSEMEKIQEKLPETRHVLLGEPSMNVGTIHGGIQNNVVPDQCVIDIDRRTVPGETPEMILKQMDLVLSALSQRDDSFKFRRTPPSLIDLPYCADPEEKVSRASLNACRSVMGDHLEFDVLSCSTDASKLGPLAGIPCIILGPGSLAQAHTSNEYIDIESVVKCAEIYTRIIMNYPD